MIRALQLVVLTACGLSAAGPDAQIQALRTEMTQLEGPRPRVALEKARQLLALLEQHPEPLLEMEVLTDMTRLHIQGQDLAAAHQTLERGSRLASGHRGTRQARRLGATQASLSFFEGDLEKAKREAKIARDEALAAEDFSPAIEAIGVLGQAEAQQGNFTGGIEHLQLAITLCDRVNSPERRQSLLSVLSNFYSESHDWKKALQANAESMVLARRLGDPRRIGVLLLNGALIRSKLGDFTTELADLKEAETLGRASGNEGLLLDAELGLVDVALREGRYSEALERAERAHARATRLASQIQQHVAAFARGTALNRLGRHREGLAEMERALAGFTDSKLETESQEFLLNLSEEYAFAGDFRTAHARLKTAKAQGDRLFSEERTKALGELEARFQNERQAGEIAQLKAREQRRTLVRNFSILAAILSLALMGAVVSRLRASRRNEAVLEQRVQARTAALEQSQELVLRTQRLNLVATVGAGIAHDLDNLLTVITTLSRQPEAREELEAVAHRAANLARKTLDLGGRDGAKVELVEVGELLEGLEPVLRRLLGRGIDLALSCRGGECWMEVEPVHLEQVIVNLVTNARDALKGEGHLRLDLVREGEQARLEVEDDGEGMTEEVKGRIFDPFFTTKGAGKGTGLGLPSILAFMQGHGGTVAVESTLGQGTCFTLTLPVLGDL